jgi:Flp pilus assembly protein CpaB
MRTNKTLLIVGLVLALVAVGGLLFAGRLLNPPPTQVPVAVEDLPAGMAVRQEMFRLEAWHGLEPQTQQRIYLPGNFPAGRKLLVDVPAGSPLYKAYVDTEEAGEYVTRMTHLITGTDQVLMAIPVSPDAGGNIPVAGDEVDLVVSIGVIRAETVQSHPTPTPKIDWAGRPMTETLADTEPATVTLPLPLSALVLENIPVEKVEREEVTTTASGYTAGTEGEPESETVYGDTERLYVAVSRAQAEVLGFLLHNGELVLAVHQPGLGAAYPGGITWEDFEKRFFAHRPETNVTPAPIPAERER